MDQDRQPASEKNDPSGVDSSLGAKSQTGSEAEPQERAILNVEESPVPRPLASADPLKEAGLPPEAGAPPSLSDKWLEAFYKECGREITLAYTTLNQMKNFAMIAVAAAISGVAFSKDAERFPDERMFVGVVIVYVFVLRFFFRAIICYINLTRWNNLQNASMKLTLLPDSRPDRAGTKTEREDSFKYNYQHFYLQWLSPISRSAQVAANLKLGFGLLFALPILFGVWGVISLWSSPIVEGMTTFAFGITFVEVYDFFVSEVFDNVRAQQHRKVKRRDTEYYPTPAARWLFALQWLIVALLSLSVMLVREHWLTNQVVNPAVPTTGGLVITSDPIGATTYIDGVQKGSTPLSIIVATGNRTIEVRQNGFAPSDVAINVIPGQSQSVFLHLHDLPKSARYETKAHGKN